MAKDGLKIRIVVFVTIGVTMVKLLVMQTAPQEQNLNLYITAAVRVFILAILDAMYKQQSASLC